MAMVVVVPRAKKFQLGTVFCRHFLARFVVKTIPGHYSKK